MALGKEKREDYVCPGQSVIQFLDEKNLMLGTNQPYFLLLWTKIGVRVG